MAKNTGHGSLRGTVAGRTQLKTRSGTWVKRSTSTGRFLQAKKSGGSFQGVRKEK